MQRLLPQVSRMLARLQAGSVSEADYEALVLKLHDIQVRHGGRRRCWVNGAVGPAPSAASVQLAA